MSNLALYVATQLALQQANADTEQIYQAIRESEKIHREIRDRCMAGAKACMTYVYSGGKISCQK